MDVFNKSKRSWIMSRIKSKETKPEIKIRSIVHRLGFRFRKNKKDLPGSPDLVLPRYHKVIFVNGCFWHGHEKCKRSSRPTSNEAFWRKKLDSNVARDKQNIKQLKQRGWKVLVIWECEMKMKNNPKLLSKIIRYLHDKKES